MIPNPLKNLNRHAAMATLLYKYSNSDLVRKSGLAEHLSNDDTLKSADQSHDWEGTGGAQRDTDGEPTPDELARDLEAMGPTFIKLGQLLSTRPDFLPAPYLDALARLQDDAEPVECREIFRVVEQELGAQPENLFASFDIEPLATASLGQVHRARMHDGLEVVVKIQRPGVREILHSDIRAMEELASICENFQFGRQFQLKHIVASLKDSLTQEVSYLREAQNAQMLSENLSEFENIVIPKVIDTLSTDSVITTEFVSCTKVTELNSRSVDPKKLKSLASELFKCFLHQVLVHGAFHADPHPGNVALTDDEKIVLMDHGLVVKLTPALQRNLIKLLLAICDGDGEKASIIAETVGSAGEHFDSDAFRTDIARVVAENVNQSVQQMDAGAAIMNIQQVSGENSLVLPQEVILLGRSLMHLERVVSGLDPEFDPNQAIRRQSMEIMQQHSERKLSLAAIYQTFMESTEFAQQLPERANKLADLVTNNQLEFKVKTIDEDKFLNGLNKVANRISAGLVIAAMIIGASLMMRLETSWTILGYPFIAMFFFLLAACAGSTLVWKAIVTDRFDK